MKYHTAEITRYNLQQFQITDRMTAIITNDLSKWYIHLREIQLAAWSQEQSINTQLKTAYGKLKIIIKKSTINIMK